ncbi:hypothetical protein MARLIPOL_03250 [Marinobacter lipolyticus SM19]|uniref:Uncharacterized protein n=1 Tax=Marinobacter lipolyticus SM19 TaxID=1318628 RepID=R8B516_9GAMM|nr:hypothetical protein [Marinobacter lipolyticus]EON93687.1 hypothetical protein MARLIPOL_03250 [Marinobacter lipolyticus SM19]
MAKLLFYRFIFSEFDGSPSIKNTQSNFPNAELACSLPRELEETEHNVVSRCEQWFFVIQGEVGGEFLGVHRKAEMPDITDQDCYIVCTHPPFEEFVGSLISHAGQMGSAWHGHEFEFTFKGIFGKSMLIQSIYCGS